MADVASIAIRAFEQVILKSMDSHATCDVRRRSLAASTGGCVPRRSWKAGKHRQINGTHELGTIQSASEQSYDIEIFFISSAHLGCFDLHPEYSPPRVH